MVVGSMREVVLQQIPHVHRAVSLNAASAVVPSGFAGLDQILGGGWPVPGLLELLCDQSGLGELQLLVPLMKSLSTPIAAQVGVCRPVLWINPPYEPHALALAQHGIDPGQHWCMQNLSVGDALWAAEQSLRSGACAMLLCWLQGLNMSSLRRLKLAALSGACVGVLLRPTQVAAQPTPANLRLCLAATAAGLQIEVLKVQGRRPGRVLLRVTPQAAGQPSQAMS